MEAAAVEQPRFVRFRPTELTTEWTKDNPLPKDDRDNRADRQAGDSDWPASRTYVLRVRSPAREWEYALLVFDSFDKRSTSV